MKYLCVIPTRGDRPQFVEQAQKLLEGQSKKPETIIIAESPKGVTGNIRAGYEKADKNRRVLIIEDDDYYGKDYIQFIDDHWDESFDLFGFNETTYYSLTQRAWKKMKHPGRSSMFQMGMMGGLNVDWPEDSYSFLDLKLWEQVKAGKLSGQLISGEKAIGIKHGIGRSGGAAHLPNFIYDHKDPSMIKLSELTDKDPFYINLAYKLAP